MIRTAGPARRASATRMALAILAAGVAVLGPAVPAAASSTIDPARPASLTIHKLEQPDDLGGLLPGSGAEITPDASLGPVPGVGFTIERVDGIDLTTAAGWADTFVLSGEFDAADPSGSIARAGHSLVDARSAETDERGIAEFDGLPLGVWVVTETSAPAGVAPSAPFVVVLPVTDPASPSDWLYDIHVYPKNAIDSSPAPPGFVTKTADDTNAYRIGDIITWHVSGQILDGGSVLWWRITDELDPRLRFAAARVALADGSAALAEGTDYTVELDAATNTVKVEFLGPPGTAGLGVLTAHADTTVEIDLDTELLDASTVPNTAFINTAIWDDPVGVVTAVDGSTAQARTAWGGIRVHKTDEAGNPLAGAVFTVHASEADARSGANPIALADGATRVVTGADGDAEVRGLRFSAMADGAPVTPDDPRYRRYWLREEQAPAGYDAIAEPIAFEVDAATTDGTRTLRVVDPRNAVAALAWTGVTNLPWALLGAALTTGGFLLVLAARRRRARRGEATA